MKHGHGVRRTDIPSRPGPPLPSSSAPRRPACKREHEASRRRVLEGLVTAQNAELPWAPSIHSLWFPRHTGSEGSSLCSH